MRLLDIRFNSPSELQATFAVSHLNSSNVDLTITLEAEGYDREKVFEEIVKIVEVVRYCHDYEHCSECCWRQFLTIVSRCRESVPVTSRQTAVTIKIQDRIIEDLAAEDKFLESTLSYLKMTISNESSPTRVALPN